MTAPAVYLALGSNLGDRSRNLLAAIRGLADFATVEASSFLYETPPAYITDQPDFLNAACRIRTRLSPDELLAALEQVMAAMGRQRTVKNGPRLIDMDILLYGDMAVETGDLTLPHPRMAERDFVLEPLCDIAADLNHPTLHVTVSDLRRRLPSAPLPRVMPLGDRLWVWGKKTYLLGIINVTPDSFSGDGLGEVGATTSASLVEFAVEQAQRLAAEGADALDVGGHSTRPGHALLPEAVEIARVAPVIQALAAAVDLPISVDTFRSEVGRAALQAGAHAINDVWGLRFDPQLAAVAAQFGAPLFVMHNRLAVGYGDQFAVAPAGSAYEHSDLMADIRHELGWSLGRAEAAGLPRWLLAVDPGIGFGKTVAQNLEVIDRLAELKALGYPLLFGSSRKGFIGKLLGDLPGDPPPDQRLEGTLATCVLAIDRGADILRVHDVRAIGRAARVADAVARR